MYKSFLTLIFTFAALLSVNAQNDQDLVPTCHTDHMMQSLMEKDPILQKEFNAFRKKYQIAEDDISNRKRDLITIPVVVHVIHSGEAVGSGKNIPMSRIHDQMEILNNDYGYTNIDRQDIPDSFQDDAGNTNIQFCLVQKTASGEPHSGVNRIRYNNIPDILFIEETIKPATIWNPVKFLNIWVVEIPSPGILGYAYLPTPNILHTDQDGVVIDTDKFGNVGSNIRGRTATHEIGHFLGLAHPWGSQETCSSDDGIADTPNCRGPYFGCPNYPQVSCGTIDMSMNFMDYVNDPCMNMFTKGQAALMHEVLADERIALTNGSEYICNLALTNNEDLTAAQQLNVYPNPTDGLLVIENVDYFNDEMVQIELFDFSGKRVHFEHRSFGVNRNKIDMNFSSFKSGTFVLRMTSAKAHFTKKIVLMTGV